MDKKLTDTETLQRNMEAFNNELLNTEGEQLQNIEEVKDLALQKTMLNCVKHIKNMRLRYLGKTSTESIADLEDSNGKIVPLFSIDGFFEIVFLTL